jgi:hypothetical protein
MKVGSNIWRIGERKAGKLRILYKINNFDQIPEAHRSAIVKTEEERGKQLGPRFQIVYQSSFDQAKSGQVVNVTYRWADDSKIEIISFDFTVPVGKSK